MCNSRADRNGGPPQGPYCPIMGGAKVMAAVAWAARHTLRGHRVRPGRSPVIPAVIVWHCHRCGLIRQAV